MGKKKIKLNHDPDKICIPVNRESTLTRVLKSVFQRTKAVDPGASLTEYLLSFPVRSQHVKTLREQIFVLVKRPTANAFVDDFKQSPVCVIQEARGILTGYENLQKRFSYKLSALGPNPNSAHIQEGKKQPQLNNGSG